MEKTKRPYYIALAVLLVAAILLSSAVGGLLYKRSKGDSQVSQSNDLHKSFGVGFTDVNVTDEDSAYKAVESVKEDLGISNPRKELHLNVVQNYGKNKYYRMQQYYNEVPVYGRELVIGTNKSGKPLSLNANYRPLSKSVSTTPKVSGETVRQNVKERASKSYQKVSVPEVSEKQLQYYDFEKGEKTKLAYVVPVKTATETIEMITDAETGEVLEEVAEVPVPNTEVSLVNRGEPGALKVAYTELFAETDGRDREEKADPVSNGYPAEYRGENWASTTAETDNGNINTNYTVFTHAVTRMLEGSGNSSAAISEEDMIQLLVGALLKFNLDETFQQAADAVYAEAEYLNSTGTLTEPQVNAVANAFAEAGLPVTEESAMPVAATLGKENTVSDELEVVKTMRYAAGPTEWEASYDYDLENKVLNVTDREVTYDGWGDPREQINSDDALLWNGMLQGHPELMLSYSADTLFEDLLLLAYNPLITSGRITEIHKKTIMNQDETTEYVTTLKVKDGKLMELHENIVNGDYAADLRYEYDSQGRVVAVETNGFETIEEWDETLLRLKYEDMNGSTKITLTKPQGQYIYTYIYSGKVGTNGLISNVNFILRDEEYTENLDSKPVAKVFHDLDGTARYDKQGHLASLSYNSEEPNPTSVLSYDSRGNLMSAGTKSNPKMNTFTYQTLKLS